MEPLKIEIENAKLRLMEKRAFLSYADTALKHLADCGVASAKAIFASQISNAKSLGLMPYELPVIMKTLEEYGFILQDRKLNRKALPDIIRLLETSKASAQVMISVNCRNHGQLLELCHITPKGCQYVDGFSQEVLSGKHPDFKRAKFIWIRWEDGVDRSPAPCQLPTLQPISDPREQVETTYFMPFQPNPLGNYTGDCSIRALACSLDISWEEALDILATSSTTSINTIPALTALLNKISLAHPPKKKIGRRLYTVEEFCQYLTATYHEGERIFALIGRQHAAAFAPTKSPDGPPVYKVHDSWDCSPCKVGEYWVLRPDKAPKQLTLFN